MEGDSDEEEDDDEALQNQAEAEPEDLPEEDFAPEEEEPARPAPVRARPVTSTKVHPPVVVGPDGRCTGVIKGFNKRLAIGGIACSESGRLVKVPVAELAG